MERKSSDKEIFEKGKKNKKYFGVKDFDEQDNKIIQKN